MDGRPELFISAGHVGPLTDFVFPSIDLKGSNMNKLPALVLSVSVLSPVVALCDDAPPPPPPQNVWTGKGQAGYTSSQGNTEAKSANAAIDMAYLDGPWNHLFHLGGLYGQNTGYVSAERWDTLWQTNYSFTPDFYTFGALRYSHDLFSGFDYQASASTGIGYKFINTDTTKLSAQVGVGYQVLRPEDITKDSVGEVTARYLQPSENSVIGTLGVNYSQALTKTTTLTDILLVNSGSINTLATNTLALTVKMSTKLALSLGYNVQDNTSPPPGLKKVDSLETVNLVYSF
jgi:putative salt-induced outer membrane protein